MFDSYRAKFAKAAPFIVPVMILTTLGSQFRFHEQGEEIVHINTQVASLSKSFARADAKSRLLSSAIGLEQTEARPATIISWIRDGVERGLLDPNWIEDPDDQSDVLSRLPIEERKDFVRQLSQAVDDPGKLVMLRVANPS